MADNESEYERQMARQRQLDRLEAQQSSPTGDAGASGDESSGGGSGLTRRAGDPAGMESARRFLYDEDEPSMGNPANTPLPGSFRPSSSRAEDDKEKKKRLNPTLAAFMATFQTLRGYGMKRLLILVGGVALVLVVIFGVVKLMRGKEEAHSARMASIKSTILGSKITSSGDLTSSGSPQYNAWHWISNTDTVKESDPYLLQRYALAVFFYSTSGSSDHVSPTSVWKHQDNWMSTKGHCIWYGVKCETASEGPIFNGNADVTALNMTSNSVDGTLPSELKALSNLLVMELSGNKLHGTLPGDLAAVTTLRDLILRDNQFKGSIPTMFGLFLNLRQLHLGNNQLDGKIPSEIQHIADLRALGLNKNQLKGTIPDITDLERMSILYLDENQLTGEFPFSLTKLSTLVDLRLNNNHITGTLPPELIALTRLQTLHLDENNLRGQIPAGVFTKVTRLTDLHLSKNEFDGSIPSEMSYLSDMRSLKLNNNKFSGKIPQQLGLMLDLEILNLQYNQLHGSIPELFYGLVDLADLQLQSNRLTGSIPPQIGNCHRLKNMYLDNNSLGGSLPTQLGNLKELKDMRIFKNNLTGTVPPEVCSLVQEEALTFLGADCADGGSIKCDCCQKCY